MAQSIGSIIEFMENIKTSEDFNKNSTKVESKTSKKKNFKKSSNKGNGKKFCLIHDQNTLHNSIFWCYKQKPSVRSLDTPTVPLPNPKASSPTRPGNVMPTLKPKSPRKNSMPSFRKLSKTELLNNLASQITPRNTSPMMMMRSMPSTLTSAISTMKTWKISRLTPPTKCPAERQARIRV